MIRFYEKNGFVAFDKHVFKLGDDEQIDIMMKLNLKSYNKMKFRIKYLITCLFFFVVCISYGQSCKKKYKDKLEAGSKLITCGHNFTIEKLDNGSCILKRYYPENKMITHLITVKSEKFNVKHGLYQERWDDGTLVNSGMYADNLKQGEWLENTYEKGYYENGLKEGVWKDHLADSTVVSEYKYLNGELHGEQINYDSLGYIILTEVYEHGKLISTTADTTIIHEEEMPRFPGCEDLDLSAEELNLCAQRKLLEYVYGNLKYPRKAREMSIQGKAKVQFVIDKEGRVIDIKVLNGISKEIKKEVLRLLQKMPEWRPGIQDGQAVKVLFTLPINFKLE